MHLHLHIRYYDMCAVPQVHTAERMSTLLQYPCFGCSGKFSFTYHYTEIYVWTCEKKNAIFSGHMLQKAELIKYSRFRAPRTSIWRKTNKTKWMHNYPAVMYLYRSTEHPCTSRRSTPWPRHSLFSASLWLLPQKTCAALQFVSRKLVFIIAYRLALEPFIRLFAKVAYVRSQVRQCINEKKHMQNAQHKRDICFPIKSSQKNIVYVVPFVRAATASELANASNTAHNAPTNWVIEFQRIISLVRCALASALLNGTQIIGWHVHEHSKTIDTSNLWHSQ